MNTWDDIEAVAAFRRLEERMRAEGPRGGGGGGGGGFRQVAIGQAEEGETRQRARIVGSGRNRQISHISDKGNRGWRRATDEESAAILANLSDLRAGRMSLADALSGDPSPSGAPGEQDSTQDRVSQIQDSASERAGQFPQTQASGGDGAPDQEAGWAAQMRRDLERRINEERTEPVAHPASESGGMRTELGHGTNKEYLDDGTVDMGGEGGGGSEPGGPPPPAGLSGNYVVVTEVKFVSQKLKEVVRVFSFSNGALTSVSAPSEKDVAEGTEFECPEEEEEE